MSLQQTLASPIELAGLGLHTGERCRVRIAPAHADAGIGFTAASETFPLDIRFLQSTQRATVIGTPKQRVSTIEHMLAALWAMGVDDARIEVEGPEIPIFDGSATEFVRQIEKTGLRPLKAKREFLRISRPIWVGNKESLVLALPSRRFHITFAGEFPYLGFLRKSITVTPAAFASEIAAARTFVAEDDIQSLLASGFGKGGSLENVVVLGEKSQSGSLRFPDEPARHKVLDLIGDLAFLRRRLHADIFAIRSGHTQNLALVQKLLGKEDLR